MDLRQQTIVTQASTRLAVIATDESRKVFPNSNKMQVIAAINILGLAISGIAESNGLSSSEVLRSLADDLNQLGD